MTGERKRPPWEYVTTTTDPKTGETMTIAEWKDRLEAGTAAWLKRERDIQAYIYRDGPR